MDSKDDADEIYDRAVAQILQRQTNAIMFATHNHRSIVRAWHLLREGQVRVAAEIRDVSFAQLYGMGDDLTYGVLGYISRYPPKSGLRLSVVKYIPYGSLNEVMPYLARRAEENRGMLGGSIREREAFYEELKRRLLRCLGITSVTHRGPE